MLEHYIDMREAGAEHEVYKYLANGWYIYHAGITLTIMRKEINK